MKTKTHDSTSGEMTRQATSAMVEITLQQQSWYYDPSRPLGTEGGFGRVFEGRSKDSQEVAIKELAIKAEAGAHREMRMADQLAGIHYDHVIPIYDSGFDEQRGRYYVVMAKADQSLQDELNARGKFDDKETAGILLQIAKGLAEVEDITHRDLKPANILWHEGYWKIADFGIARFVEQTTASQTLKGYLSPEYGAPEQWRGERSDALTDIYALGCIGYTLLLGHAPFAGPDYRAQHHGEKPPSLQGYPALLRTLLLRMLSKPRGTRPDRDRVIEELDCYLAEGSTPKTQAGSSLLREVGIREAELEVEELAGEAASLRAEEQENDRRAALAESGNEGVQHLTDTLFTSIKSKAPSAKDGGQESAVSRGWRYYRSILLGPARLDFVVENRLGPIARGVFARSGWDVIWGARIEVNQRTPAYKWASSLWYTNVGKGPNYRWYEVSYFSTAGVKHGSMFEPYALDPQDADAAAGPSMTLHNIAFGPRAIDDEATDAFVNRWEERLALAVNGQLTHPRHLPLKDDT